ncbi:valine--tRNA ligase-like isoform X1 [Biomphalaria glabrata]
MAAPLAIVRYVAVQRVIFGPHSKYVCRASQIQVCVFYHFQNVTNKFSSAAIAKKDVSTPMSKTYHSSEVETEWYDWWIDKGFFTPHKPSADQKVFSLLLPPPNVTGSLHLGHALTGSVQDAVVRWHRMKGYTTVWIPGTDHAGIATHAVVERKLMKETGRTRHDLGREAFVQQIWKWKEEHGSTISNQMKLLGLSLDWSREYFTLDKRLNEAVNKAFCELYSRGLIYRDKRMINWSCALQSSVSDIEVDKKSFEVPTLLQVPGSENGVQVGILSRFAYQIKDSDEKLVVATTRLETMLADTAVAVNPQDIRYSHLVGKQLIHPFDKSRLIPIIADSFVDMEFGTGAVKITPGHDPVDYEVGRRHGLPIIEILNDDGTLHKDIPDFGGLGRFQVRRKLKDTLSNLGLYCGDTGQSTVLPICSRSGDIIEPRLKEQWFLDCQNMAQLAMQAVESGQLNLVPKNNEIIWWEWLTKSQDWCLSRQLWWGHRIPVYTCNKSKETTCAMNEEEAKVKLKSASVYQDDDVLDTWFSSSLLPFSVLGWPQKTLDLEQYFPQQLMETGQDILFFWVSRMVMLSLELTGRLPFHKVLLHGMVRDAHGRKMSKSLGNVIDPLDVIKGTTLQNLEKRLEEGNLNPKEIDTARLGLHQDFPNGIAQCGADALRFTLCSLNAKNVDINFDVTNVESKLRFCNKIWQSFKFIFSKLPSDFKPLNTLELYGKEDGTDLWILSKLSIMVQLCETHFATHNFHLVTAALQQFWYQELCDVYLESVKPVFQSDDVQWQEAIQQILFLCAETFVLAAAPFMPFLCEELYQRLPSRDVGKAESVCIAEYPKPDKFHWSNDSVHTSMDQCLEIIHYIQKLRKDFNIMGTKSKAYLQTDNSVYNELLTLHKPCLLSLSKSGDIRVIKPSDQVTEMCTEVYVNPELKVKVELKGTSVDLTQELDRLQKKKENQEQDKKELNEKLDKFLRKNKGDSQKAIHLKNKIAALDKDVYKLDQMIQALQGNYQR